MVYLRQKIVLLLITWSSGGYDKEEKAARAYDLAALKYWGTTTHINFPVSFSFKKKKSYINVFFGINSNYSQNNRLCEGNLLASNLWGRSGDDEGHEQTRICGQLTKVIQHIKIQTYSRCIFL